MSRFGLLVGIDHYQNMTPLSGCVADAQAMSRLLQTHESGTPNYDCRLLTSAGGAPVTRKLLRAQWQKLFESPGADILFYFSGHGSKSGGFLITQEGEKGDPGLPMDELLAFANKSKARSVLLILDCCYSGTVGNAAHFDENHAQLREGVTILAASRSTEQAFERDGHGVFTKLVLGALSGGAADIQGKVSAASVYAYVEQALGWWEQRPMYKSHADSLPPIRRCKPAVPDSLLRELPKLFLKADSPLRLDPTFEWTEKAAKPENVKVFNKLKVLRGARLLVTKGREDLYYVALKSGWVKLSLLGQFYWDLARRGRI